LPHGSRRSCGPGLYFFWLGWGRIHPQERCGVRGSVVSVIVRGWKLSWVGPDVPPLSFPVERWLENIQIQTSSVRDKTSVCSTLGSARETSPRKQVFTCSEYCPDEGAQNLLMQTRPQWAWPSVIKPAGSHTQRFNPTTLHGLSLQGDDGEARTTRGQGNPSSAHSAFHDDWRNAET